MAANIDDQQVRETVILMPVFTAKPHFADQIEQALGRLQLLSRDDDGCIAYSVFVDLADPGRFVLYEEWTTAGALASHNDQEHVRSFLEVSTEWLVAPFAVSELRPISGGRSVTADM